MQCFCKSDCTHALNKGAAKSKVVAGLCKMMAGKIEELLNKNNQVLLVGGSSSNKIMVKYLKESGLNVISRLTAIALKLWERIVALK